MVVLSPAWLRSNKEQVSKGSMESPRRGGSGLDPAQREEMLVSRISGETLVNKPLHIGCLLEASTGVVDCVLEILVHAVCEYCV